MSHQQKERYQRDIKPSIWNRVKVAMVEKEVQECHSRKEMDGQGRSYKYHVEIFPYHGKATKKSNMSTFVQMSKKQQKQTLCLPIDPYWQRLRDTLCVEYYTPSCRKEKGAP